MGFTDSIKRAYNSMKAAALGDTDYGAGDEEYEDDDANTRTRKGEPDRDDGTIRFERARGGKPPLEPINPEKRRESSGYSYAGAEKRGSRRPDLGVVPMPGTAAMGSNIVISNPGEINDCDEICSDVRSGAAVALNLEGVEHYEAQRIVDFCAGVVAALDGSIEECADKVFIIAPRNFSITGHSREVLRKAGIHLTDKF